MSVSEAAAGVAGGRGEGGVTVSVADFMWFVDTALDPMKAILSELGDDLANRRPDLEGANSPFAILTHCLGVMEFWGGSTVADRTIQRDRAAEFVATGSVEELLGRAVAAREQLLVDLSQLDSAAALHNYDPSRQEGAPYARNQGSVLLHILEELFQHLGQMELSRDMLLGGQ